MTVTYHRYQLSWIYTDMDGTVRKKDRTLNSDINEEEAIQAYHRKVKSNDYLLGGATVSDVKLYRVRVETSFDDITPRSRRGSGRPDDYSDLDHNDIS